jgi:ubiquinone/menaquinone biosynthesis C-methylase UbiE
MRQKPKEETVADNLEEAVARHYGAADLIDRILKAMTAAGIDAERVRPEQLAPIDEFHIGGRAATMHAVAKMGLEAQDHVLDVGCGIGGASRYLASAIGCRVTGIDLTAAYIAAAEELTRRTGLGDRISYRVASALSMPFQDGAFDAAITIHAAMNIRDRAGLYREVARILKPGAAFCIYDVMKGEKDGLKYPVPWAETPATSRLTTPQEMQALLGGAGFEVREVEDRTAFGIAFFRESLAGSAAGVPPLGLHIVMGATAREKFQNMLAGLENGSIAPVLMVAQRAA